MNKYEKSIIKLYSMYVYIGQHLLTEVSDVLIVGVRGCILTFMAIA